MKEEFESVIEATDEYIESTEATSYEDFYLIRQLNNIILEDELKDYNLAFNHKVLLKKNVDYAASFLNNLNSEYMEYFYRRLEDGTFLFDYTQKEDAPYSEIDEDTKKRVIYIPTQNTIEDAFAIVHEIMHDMNLTEEECETRYFFTEFLSLLLEFLFEDYLVENKIRDAKITNNRNLFFGTEKAIETDINLHLLEKRLENGYIDSGIIIDILNYYPDYYIPNVAHTIKKICKNKELSIGEQQPYIIGTLLASYMYYRIKDKKSDIKELFELNDMIQKTEFEDIFDYLNLDYDEVGLTNTSYDTLRKNYKRYLKSR